MTHSVDEMCRAGMTTARGVRFWEDQGLLGTVERSSGGTRRYTAAQLDKARVIAAAQFAGWKLDEIKLMLESYDMEAYDAIMTRLALQMRAAETLGAALPMPEIKMDYDL